MQETLHWIRVKEKITIINFIRWWMLIVAMATECIRELLVFILSHDHLTYSYKPIHTHTYIYTCIHVYTQKYIFSVLLGPISSRPEYGQFVYAAL